MVFGLLVTSNCMLICVNLKFVRVSCCTFNVTHDRFGACFDFFMHRLYLLDITLGQNVLSNIETDLFLVFWYMVVR